MRLNLRRKASMNISREQTFFLISIYLRTEKRILSGLKKVEDTTVISLGISIDLDVNELTHIVGSFTDTLTIDGFTLEGMVYPSSAFSSTWEGT